MAHGVQATLAIPGRGYSPELWDGFDPQAFARDPGWGWFQQLDFLDIGTFAANLNVTAPHAVFTGATAGTLVQGNGLQGGGMDLVQPATINMQSYIGIGGSTSFPYYLAYPTTTILGSETTTFPFHHLARVRYETRFLVSTVVDDVLAAFFGLGGTTVATGNLAVTTGQLVSTYSGIGFDIVHANGTTGQNAKLRFVYQENGSAIQVKIANAVTLAANVWHTAGFDFNPVADSPSRIGSVWVDGVKQSTYITAANIQATTFPRSDDTTQYPMQLQYMSRNGTNAAARITFGGTRICSELIVARGTEVSG